MYLILDHNLDHDELMKLYNKRTKPVHELDRLVFFNDKKLLKESHVVINSYILNRRMIKPWTFTAEELAAISDHFKINFIWTYITTMELYYHHLSIYGITAKQEGWLKKSLAMNHIKNGSPIPRKVLGFVQELKLAASNSQWSKP